MTPVWAVCLPNESALAAAGLRLERAVEVLETPAAIWLRGSEVSDRLNKLLWQLPGALRFDVLPGGELQPVGSRLPGGRLPAGSWVAIRTWAQIELPPAEFAGEASHRVALQLVRTAGEHDANVLLLALADWEAYGVSAPQIRLNQWRFAVSAKGMVIVHGRPLPPLPGERFFEQSGIALPCGWGWLPSIEAGSLATVWRLKPNDLALVSVDGSWQRIRADQFAKATRSAIRETHAM
jgi:hypothetical protein